MPWLLTHIQRISIFYLPVWSKDTIWLHLQFGPIPGSENVKGSRRQSGRHQHQAQKVVPSVLTSMFNSSSLNNINLPKNYHKLAQDERYERFLLSVRLRIKCLTDELFDSVVKVELKQDLICPKIGLCKCCLLLLTPQMNAPSAT